MGQRGLINGKPGKPFTHGSPDSSSYGSRAFHLYTCASTLTSPCTLQTERCLWDRWIYGHRHPLLTADLSRSVPEKLISSTVKLNEHCLYLIRQLWFSFMAAICPDRARNVGRARGDGTIITWKEMYAFQIWLWQTTVQEISQSENRFHKSLASGKCISWVKRGVLHVGSYRDLGLCGLPLRKAGLVTLSEPGLFWKIELCDLWPSGSAIVSSWGWKMTRGDNPAALQLRDGIRPASYIREPGKIHGKWD